MIKLLANHIERLKDMLFPEFASSPHPPVGVPRTSHSGLESLYLLTFLVTFPLETLPLSPPFWRQMENCHRAWYGLLRTNEQSTLR